MGKSTHFFGQPVYGQLTQGGAQHHSAREAIKLKNINRIKHSFTFINYQLLFHTFGVFTSDKKRSVHLQFYSLDRGLNIYVLFHNFIIQESSL